MLGAVEIDGAVLGIIGAFLVMIAGALVGLLAWGLKQVVSLAQIVAAIQVRHDEHDRRLDEGHERMSGIEHKLDSVLDLARTSPEVRRPHNAGWQGHG